MAETSQYERFERKHKKALKNIVKLLKKITKETLPYHTTSSAVDILEKARDEIEQLQSTLAELQKENKRLKETMDCMGKENVMRHEIIVSAHEEIHKYYDPEGKP